MKIDQIYDNIEIVDSGISFEGIAKIDNFTTFIDNAIISENVKIKIKKITKSYAKAKLIKINTKSKYRQKPKCEVFAKCGGCSCQHIAYDYTLELKHNIIENCLKKLKVNYLNLDQCIGMNAPYYYRNKVQYPVRCSEGKTSIGFYQKNSHKIIPNLCCYIQDQSIEKIAKQSFNILNNLGFKGYDETNGSGDIRHIIVRRGLNTQQTMIVIVVNDKKMLQDKHFLDFVESVKKDDKDDNIKSIVLNLNSSRTNEIISDKNKVIYGRGYIIEKIEKYKYLISPNSFFQVNTIQAQVLYDKLKNGLNLSSSDILFDLYSGVGSIGIYLSQNVKKVYGIEIEEQAVKMANQNLKLNDIKNCEYIAGSVEDKIQEFKIKKIIPDVIVVDPPRKGLDNKSIEYILEFNAKKIGYVSCNPATLARDLKKLEQKYDIVNITPVDMFPQTSSVENVAILKLKK